MYGELPFKVHARLLAPRRAPQHAETFHVLLCAQGDSALDLYDAIANEEVPYPRHVAVSGAPRCGPSARSRGAGLTAGVLGIPQMSCRTSSCASCTATQRSASLLRRCG